MITLTGKKISEGIAIGKLLFYRRDIKDIRRIYVKDVEKEIQRLNRAKEKAIYDLEMLYDVSSREVGEANAAIFEMQRALLSDDGFWGVINRKVVEEKLNAEYIIQEVSEKAASFADSDSLVHGHDADVKDLGLRLIRILSRSFKDRMYADEPFIMGAGELYPSEAIQLERNKVKGFVTRYGTINSHTAVLARTLGIPAVIGVGEVLKDEYDGKTIIIDGYEGKIYIEPDYTTMTKMRERMDENRMKLRNLERLKGKENVTQSGQRIDVYANIGTREDIEKVLRSDAGGIGLFRSEFLYMENGEKLPTEEQLYQVYKLAAESMGVNRVVIRVADFGGDKLADCIDLGAQTNPMMGMRGLRVLFEREDIFLTQLRAILRASAFGNVAIMLPMVTSVEEVKKAKTMIAKAKLSLKEERIAYDENINVGVMIETPAAVMLSGELAREMDFFSIGTNDLTQLILCADRTNPAMEKYYDPHHPALLKMIRIVANNVHLEGKRISICGDLAADLSLTETFIQMGIEELSVAPEAVLGLRKKIRDIR